MLANALDFAAPTLRELAQQAGISYAAIRDYRKQRRTAPPAVMQRLADVLRTRSRRLQRLANQLAHVAAKPARNRSPRRTR